MKLNTPHKSAHLYEVDGLRAFAVLSVLAFHAFPSWFKGGFVGVDIFFVISGFLITRNIFENLANDKFCFSDFFGRRIRRIFPSLVVVMICSLAFGWLVLTADEFIQLGKHVASSAAFLINFILVSELGYFDNAAETKPMLHLWSLAVEEQFYIVWPFVLWLLWKSKLNLLLVIFLVSFFSFYINLKFVNSHPNETFFWPLGRFWELLSGSILAWIVIYRSEKLSRFKLWIDNSMTALVRFSNISAYGSPTSNLLSFTGLLLLVCSVFFISDDLSFPSYWALLPVCGSILIVSGGSEAWLTRITLVNPVAVWFGLISYPLYLWHWPILSYLRILSGQTPAWELTLVGLLTSIFFAWLTHRYVENYFRRQSPNLKRSLLNSFAIVIVGFIGVLIYEQKIKSYSAEFYPSQRTLPDIIPTSIDKKNDCFSRLGIPLDSRIRYCQISSTNGTPTVALIGDSHSASAFTGTSYYLKKEHNLTVVNLAGRLFSNVINYPKGDEFEKNVYLGGIEVADYVASSKNLTTVIMISRGFWYLNWAENFHIPDKIHITDKEEIFIEGLKDLLEKFHDKKIIFVLENPTLPFDPTNCGYQRLLNLFAQKCSVSREIDAKIHGAYIRKTTDLLAEYENVTLVDPRDVFCDKIECHASKHGQILYGDRHHLNRFGSLIQGKQISQAFDIDKSN